MNKRIVLASLSPRRASLLKKAGFDFIIDSQNVDEIIDPSLGLNEAIEKIAYQKALPISLKYPDDIVIAADTVVSIYHQILGKPKDDQDAFKTLKLLSNNTHEVISGVCVISNRQVYTFHEVSKVCFKELDNQTIWNYIKTGEGKDKAASYGIQGLAKDFVDHYEGDYDSIVGLPISRLKKLVRSIL